MNLSVIFHGILYSGPDFMADGGWGEDGHAVAVGEDQLLQLVVGAYLDLDFEAVGAGCFQFLALMQGLGLNVGVERWRDQQPYLLRLQFQVLGDSDYVGEVVVVEVVFRILDV